MQKNPNESFIDILTERREKKGRFLARIKKGGSYM
jgi:hypothetical protein